MVSDTNRTQRSSGLFVFHLDVQLFCYWPNSLFLFLRFADYLVRSFVLLRKVSERKAATAEATIVGRHLVSYNAVRFL